MGVDVDVDRGGITFRQTAQFELSDSLDVLFDGQRVCSVSPLRGQLMGDDRYVPWPKGLRRYLHGTTTLTLRSHLSGLAVFQLDVDFDSARHRLRVVDSAGRPIAFDKWGQPGRAFESTTPDEARTLASQVRALLDDLNREVGLPAFVAYGTLLGAVRTGHLIGHDFDADVAYLSDHWHPSDVALESFSVQRRLRRMGWYTERPCESMYQIRVSRGSSAEPFVDIFPAYFHERQLHIPPLARGLLRRDQVLPLGVVDLESVQLPAPADAAAVLELTYGPSWQVPDPAFTFGLPDDYRRQMRGWMGNHLARPGRWRRWHRDVYEDREPAPSPFADWMLERVGPDAVVLDVGCGQGADTLAIAERSRCAHGIDFADEAVAAAQARAKASGQPATFHKCTLYDLRETLARTLQVALVPGKKALYARLAYDALGPSGRANLLLAARTLLHGGGRAYFELRDRRGNPFEQLPPAPWAGVVNPDEFTRDVAARGGTVEHVEVAPGPFPEVGRPTTLRRVVARF